MKRSLLLILFLGIGMLSAQSDPFNSPTALVSDTLENQGVAFADYDGDGWVDLYITRGNRSNGDNYTNLLFKNNQFGTLVRQTGVDGATEDSTSGGATWGDFNNDGYLDLYVANAQDGPSPPFGNATPKQNHLFKGTSSGLELVSGAGDITSDAEDSRQIGWGDLDNDGYLDMFVENAKVGIFGPGKGQNSFYKNDGEENFTKTDVGNLVSDDSEYTTFNSGFAWSDYNNDGYFDIFNGSGFGTKNRLWKNDGDGSGFTEVLSSFFQDENNNTSTIGVSWADFDNDSDMDLFVANIIDGNTRGWNFLYENNSTPTSDAFSLVSGNTDLDSTFDYTIGSAWADFDNDGDLDLFVSNDANGANDISRLYFNSGNPNYNLTPVTSVVETLNPGDGSRPGFGRGAATADINNDGDIDLVVARHGKPLLYTNSGNSNNYVHIILTGNGSTNYSAIGVKVFVVADITEQGGETKQMREIAGITGTASQNDIRAHFGLGSAAIIDSIIIEWPGSETTDVYTDLPVNQIHSFVEGSTSSIEEELIGSPNGYRLEQNFPNPFNPQTNIQYSLKKSGNVTINVYDVLGRKVVTLIDDFRAAGTYNLTFDGTEFPSGIYYYRVVSSDFVSTRKMILTK